MDNACAGICRADRDLMSSVAEEFWIVLAAERIHEILAFFTGLFVVDSLTIEGLMGGTGVDTALRYSILHERSSIQCAMRKR